MLVRHLVVWCTDVFAHSIFVLFASILPRAQTRYAPWFPEIFCSSSSSSSSSSSVSAPSAPSASISVASHAQLSSDLQRARDDAQRATHSLAALLEAARGSEQARKAEATAQHRWSKQVRTSGSLGVCAGVET